MEKVVKALFVCLLIVFPIGQLGRVEVGGGVAILLNDIVVFFVVGSWLVARIQRRSFPNHKLTIPIATFAGAALFSLLLRFWDLSLQHFLTSSLYLVRWVTYAGLFFVVMDFDERFKHKALYGLLLAGFATALIGFIQYFLYPDLRNIFYAGWDEHLYRLFSNLLDPNFAGGIFVLTFILATSITFNPKFSFPRSDLARLAHLSVAFASIIGLLLTYSRGSFLSFLVATLTLFIREGKRRLILVLLVVFGLGMFFLPKNLQSEGVELLRTASITARLESAQNAIAIFRDNPLFGTGFNAYRYAQREKGFLEDHAWEQIHSGAGTDNSFLFVLATTGIVGFVAYLYLWTNIIKESLRNPLVISSILAIFVHALFVNSLFYPWVMEWLWILVGASTARRAL